MSTPQQPLNSGFGPASTATDVIAGISLVGKTAIVTGGYAGLGLEAARTLASAGARVIVPARDIDRARKAVAETGAPLEIHEMDLTEPASIDRFARNFLQTGLKLDILVNSAGIMAVPDRQLDKRGNELQFSTNHLGHFQLVARLWPALKRSGNARVVSVSSLGHRFSEVVFDDINFDNRDYNPWTAYGQSKTANVLFAVGLDRRGRDHGVRAYSLHPGGIITGLAKHIPMDDLKRMGNVDENGEPVIDPARDMKSVQQGAATHVWCAVSPLLDGKGGVFCASSDITPIVSQSGLSSPENAEERFFRVIGVEAYAVDPEKAERLWQISETLTGVTLAD